MASIRQKLVKDRDRLYSLWRRQSSADDKGIVFCCTCGTPMYWRQAHLGHFMPRQRMTTRWTDTNTDIQCTRCNTFNEGEQFKMARYLDNKYGKGTAESMEAFSRLTVKVDTFTLRYAIQELKDKLKAHKFKIR